MTTSDPMDLRNRITTELTRLVRNHPQNSLHMDGGEAAWGNPLVGFAPGDDPLFTFLKDDIGEFYWTPAECFNLAHDSEDHGPVTGDDLTVIAWALPQTDRTRRDQAGASRLPAERWVRSRGYWAEFSRELHQDFVDLLAGAGLTATAPEFLAEYRRERSLKYGWASRWSQRHTAYVAGLGTFGLSDGLITPLGKSMRFGSVIIRARLPVEPRPYYSHQEYCGFFRDGSCKVCIRRCPAGAISPAGHDKEACYTYIHTRVVAARRHLVPGENTGCGLCQCGVPCEAGIPGRTGV